jgi:hypothetical protein
VIEAKVIEANFSQDRLGGGTAEFRPASDLPGPVRVQPPKADERWNACHRHDASGPLSPGNLRAETVFSFDIVLLGEIGRLQGSGS